MKRLILVAFFAIVAPLGAQQGAINAPFPQISVGSVGEVKVTPDRANIQISVQTKAATAAAASTENASRQKAVIDALRALGLRADQISTVGYNVMPEQRYEPNREPVVVGYNVTNTISVDVTDLSMVGRIIDTSIARGANMISSLNFYASNTEFARREAIATAIQKARLDADAAARAAGGTIGGLLEVSVGAYFPPPRPVEYAIQLRAAAAADTPIQPGDQTLSVNVNTRWSFIAGAGR
ncbi:MAG: SIMPL domain-containing protein [Gemmatimonadaceae bacterium]